MLIPVLAALSAEVVGSTIRATLLVRIGTTTTRAAATTVFLACGWRCAPDDMLKIVHPCTIFNFGAVQKVCKYGKIRI